MGFDQAKWIIQRLRANEEGATAIEYALIAVLVSIGAIVAMTNFADALIAMFNHVASVVTSAAG